MRSDNSVLQFLAHKLYNNSPTGQIANSYSADNIAELYERGIAGKYAPNYQNHYGAWYKDTYTPDASDNMFGNIKGAIARNFHRDREMAFGREVMEYLNSKRFGKQVDAHPAVISAAEDIDRAYLDLLSMHKKFNVEGFEDIEFKPGHFSVAWLGDRWSKARKAVGEKQLVQTLKEGIMRAEAGIDENTAFIYANAIKRHAREQGLPNPTGSLNVHSAETRELFEDTLRELGWLEDQIGTKVDEILGVGRGNKGLRASNGRIPVDYSTNIPGTDMQLFDLIDNDVYGALDRAVRGQTAAAAMVEATGGLLQKQDVAKWRTAVKDYAMLNDLDAASDLSRFDEMMSMFNEGAFNGGTGAVVGNLNKLSRKSYLAQMAITQTAELGIAAGRNGLNKFFKFYGKSFKEVINGIDDDQLVQSLAAGGRYHAPQDFYVRSGSLDDYTMEHANTYLKMLDHYNEKGSRLMGHTSLFYTVLEKQQKAAMELSNDYLVNGVLKGTVPKQRLIASGVDTRAENVIRKNADKIEYDSEGYIVNMHFNEWDPDDADLWRMVVSSDTDWLVQRTRRGAGHSWANTPVGGLMTGLMSFSMNAMFTKSIKSARLADKESAAQFLYGIGSAGLAVTAHAAVNGKLDDMDMDDLVRRSLNWSAHVSPVLMATDPLSHIMGLDYIGDGSLGPLARYRYAQDGLIGLPPGLTAAGQVLTVPRTLPDLLDDGEIDWATANSLKAIPIVGRMYGVPLIIDQMKE
jgi:hypothetical protein